MRGNVAVMQRRALEVTTGWDVEDVDMAPPALERLAEIAVPILVLLGGLDLDAVHHAAARVVNGIAEARRVDRPDVAHLPSMERAEDLTRLVRGWLAERSARG